MTRAKVVTWGYNNAAQRPMEGIVAFLTLWEHGSSSGDRWSVWMLLFVKGRFIVGKFVFKKLVRENNHLENRWASVLSFFYIGLVVGDIWFICLMAWKKWTEFSKWVFSAKTRAKVYVWGYNHASQRPIDGIIAFLTLLEHDSSSGDRWSGRRALFEAIS